MPVKVIKDGQMVERLSGDASLGLGDRKVRVGYTTIEYAGAILADDQVDDQLLELVKDGEVPGLAYFDDEDEAREAGEPEPTPVPLSAADAAASVGVGLASEPDLAQDNPDEYDPSSYNQAQVLEYLADADDDEVERVQAAERSGQNRQGIAAYKRSESSE
jgi:hypothetical protein